MFAFIRKNVRILDYFLVCESGRTRAESITFFFALETGDGEGMVHFGMAASPPALDSSCPSCGRHPSLATRVVCVCDVGSERRAEELQASVQFTRVLYLWAQPRRKESLGCFAASRFGFGSAFLPHCFVC